MFSYRERQPLEKPCFFDVAVFKECANYPYGFDKKNPCIFVKLNKIFGFTPKPYLPGDDLSNEDIPQNIKNKIKDENEPPRVYIECHGENPADIEALDKKIKYFPEHQGIPMGFFPHQVGKKVFF